MVPVALVALHVAAAAPLIVRGVMTGRWGEDQINYHEPAVRVFAQELPTPNVRDYHSATTPGYHLIVAALSRIVGDSTMRLQLIGSLFTVALLASLGAAVALRYREHSAPGGSGTRAPWHGEAGSAMALAVCLPVACSMYVFQAGVWLLPDNAGWLGVLAMMVVALRFRASVGTFAAGAAALVMLVLFRQIHIWAAGLLWVGAWLSVRGAPAETDSIRELVTHPSLRMRRAAGAVASTLPAFVVLYLFYDLWGGLTPREFQGQYKGFNPAAPAFILAVLGVASVFFVGFIAEGMWSLLTRRRALLAGAIAIGLVIGAAPATSYSVADGRFSGLWKVAEKLPLIAGHAAPAIVALSVLGAVTTAAWFVSLPWRERWFFLAALCGFAAAQSASFQIWQRYNEPFVLMLLALLSSSVAGLHEGDGCAMAPGAARRAPCAPWLPALRLGGPVVLAAGCVLLAVVTMRSAPRASLFDKSVLPPAPAAAPSP